jgi:colanic acid/amylovoran biosynthesis glycosyltransferase
MRIIYVTANLPYGTDESFIIAEIEELSRRGHEVLVVPRSPRGPCLHGRSLLKQAHLEPLCSTRVCRAALRAAAARPTAAVAAIRPLLQSRSLTTAVKNFSVLPKALWLAELASGWQADHIHCHWAGTTATMTMVASRLSGIPWSLTAHRWDIVENNLLSAKIGSASLARFISHDGLEMAKAIGIPQQSEVRVIHMGVSLPGRCKPPLASSPVVLCPARLVEVKGHRFLLQAWRLLRDRGVEAELRLAGQGELQPHLLELTRDLGLTGCVTFLGAVPHHELLKMYEQGSISCVALASVDLGNGFHEGIPVALIEAMSYGVPVVATKTGGTAELVLPGTGMLVPARDPEALADALQTMLQHAPLAQRIGERGRQRVVKAYDIVRVASTLADAFSATRHSNHAVARRSAGEFFVCPPG